MVWDFMVMFTNLVVVSSLFISVTLPFGVVIILLGMIGSLVMFPVIVRLCADVDWGKVVKVLVAVFCIGIVET